MESVNSKLQDKADSFGTTSLTSTDAESGVAKEETVHGLVDRWATLNLGRALLTGAGAVCAAWAIVSKLEVVGMGHFSLTSGANRMG